MLGRNDGRLRHTPSSRCSNIVDIMLRKILRRISGAVAKPQPCKDDSYLGLGLKPGDAHYRAYVGPPQDYDLVSAMSFNLLTTLGLRQHHRLLDIGCGSLRNARLLIPYLNVGNYVGIEPNFWLVRDGIANELGDGLISIKKPILIAGDSMQGIPATTKFDYAIAQSIFSHCGTDLIEDWLMGVARHLQPEGLFVATFLVGDADFEGKGWVYPACVEFKPSTVHELAQRAGLRLVITDWFHPRQKWGVFMHADTPQQWFEHNEICWNNMPRHRRT